MGDSAEPRTGKRTRARRRSGGRSWPATRPAASPAGRSAPRRASAPARSGAGGGWPTRTALAGNGGRRSSSCPERTRRRGTPSWSSAGVVLGSPSAVLIPAAERRIWLCVAPADMRRSFDGLTASGTQPSGRGPGRRHDDTAPLDRQTPTSQFDHLRCTSVARRPLDARAASMSSLDSACEGHDRASRRRERDISGAWHKRNNRHGGSQACEACRMHPRSWTCESGKPVRLASGGLAVVQAVSASSARLATSRAKLRGIANSVSSRSDTRRWTEALPPAW